MNSSAGAFLVALNIALAIVVIAWLHNPPFDYQGKQSEARPKGAIGQHGVANGIVADTGTDKDSTKGHDKKGWKSYLLDHLPDWFVAAFTGLLAVVTYLLVRSTNRLWEAGERQMSASQRAWIPFPDVEFAHGLNFGPHGCDTAIRIDIRNSGNAPALHLKLYAWLLHAPNAIVPVGAALAKFDEVRREPVEHGYALFPNTKFPTFEGWRPPARDARLTRQQVNEGTGGVQGGPMRLYLAGCINYSFPSDLKRYHQTGFFYEVETSDGMLVHTADGRIPHGRLRLSKISFDGTDRVD